MGLFSEKRDSFGLDVGSSGVRLVHLEKRPTGHALTALAMVDLPLDAINEGSIKDLPAVVDAIKEVVAKSGVKIREAAIGVSGHSIIMKRISLPKASPKELAGAIQLEAEHHIPFAIDDVYLDYQALGETNGGSMDVMLVAVKRAKVDEYVAAVEGAGLWPSVVDVDVFALENQYETSNPERGRETVALIDIGASVMKTNVIRNGVSFFARDIAFGGHNYTQAVAQQLGIPLAKAEAAKRGDESQGIRWNDLVPALETVSRDLSLEIQRTFDYFASTAESHQIDRIVLSGGCARLQGIDRFLSSSSGIPVEIAKPFLNIQIDPARFPADDLVTTGPLWAVAVGLGVRRRGDKPA